MPSKKSELQKLNHSLKKFSDKNPAQLKEYNFFMRRQINNSKSFSQALKLWNAYSKASSKPVPKKIPEPKPKAFSQNPPKALPKPVIPKKLAPPKKLSKKPQAGKQLLPPQPAALSNEQVALEITKFYLGEIASQSVKREIDLEGTVRAYFFALEKVSGHRDK